MSFADYSTTPGANTSIAGTNIAEECPAGNVNNAIRQLMADGKALSDTVEDLDAGMPVSGGAFTGSITRSGAGAYPYDVDTTLTSGRRFWLVEGSPLPASPQEGDEVTFYAA